MELNLVKVVKTKYNNLKLYVELFGVPEQIKMYSDTFLGVSFPNITIHVKSSRISVHKEGDDKFSCVFLITQEPDVHKILDMIGYKQSWQYHSNWTYEVDIIYDVYLEKKDKEWEYRNKILASVYATYEEMKPYLPSNIQDKDSIDDYMKAQFLCDKETGQVFRKSELNINQLEVYANQVRGLYKELKKKSQYSDTYVDESEQAV